MDTNQTWPRHVGFIIDANRRWAEGKNLDVRDGHTAGCKVVRQVLQWMVELDLAEVTIYALSLKNLQRTAVELEHLMHIFQHFFSTLGDQSAIHENHIRVNVFGQLERLPVSLKHTIDATMKQTSQYGAHQVNFAIAYDGRAEIIGAMQSIAQAVRAGKMRAEDITEAVVNEHLLLSSEPDLIIRTGNDHRSSGFLMWQSLHSEWWITSTLWPDFTKADLIRAIRESKERHRTLDGK